MKASSSEFIAGFYQLPSEIITYILSEFLDARDAVIMILINNLNHNLIRKEESEVTAMHTSFFLFINMHVNVYRWCVYILTLIITSLVVNSLKKTSNYNK